MITTTENPAVPLHPTSVNLNVLIQKIQKILHNGQYEILKSERFTWYGRIFRYPKYAICHILVTSTADTFESAERRVLALETECSLVRRHLLLGKPLVLLSAQQHHFISLHKRLERPSYTFAGLPVGFLITPVIFLQESGKWECLQGRSTRIDSVSIDPQTVQFFLQLQQEYLETHRASLLDLKKFYYWKMANYLLNYGPAPFFGLWGAKSICAIIQIPFLPLSAMLGLTFALYGSFLVVIYLMYSLFSRSQENELRATVSSAPTGHFEESVSEEQIAVSEENPEGVVAPEEPDAISTPEDDLEVTLDEEVSPPPTNPTQNRTTADEYYLPVIQNNTRNLLKLHIPKAVSTQAAFLLRKSFCWILAQTQRNIPRDLPLPDLLKLVHGHRIVKKWLPQLRLWLGKITTETPFEAEEVRALKNFMLFFLKDLTLLPPYLQEVFDKREGAHLPDHPSPPQSPSHIINRSTSPSDLHDQLHGLHNQVRELDTLVDSKFAGRESPPDNTPQPSNHVPQNFDVDSLPQAFHTETPEIALPFFQKMSESDKNGLYCTLIVDRTAPDLVEVITRFESCTKGLDVNHRNRMDIATIRGTSLELEMQHLDPPVVVVGCGKTRQFLPYNQGGDDVRLQSVIAGYRLTPNQITFRLKKENPEDSPIEENSETGTLNAENLPPAQVQESSLESEGAPPDLTPPKSQEAEDIMVLPPPPTIDGSAPPQTAEVEEGLQAIAETIDLSNARKKTTESSLDRDFALRQNLKRIRKGSIIVDGSNISKMIRDQHHDESPPSLDCVLGMVERLKKLGIPEEKIVVYFDASTEKEFQAIDPDILVPYKNRELFRVASSGEPLDDSLVSLGRLFGKKNFLVISTDRYREYPPWFQQHRVGATLDPNNCPFLAYPLKRLFQMYFRGEDDA